MTQEQEKILFSVRYLAIKLLDLRGLVYLWNFEFDNAKRRFGLCNHKRKTISLSKHLVLLNWEENPMQIKDVILHEIAHALARLQYGRSIRSHGYEWKCICVEIGANPERLYRSEKLNRVERNYKYKCPNCGNIYKRFRKIKGILACGSCCKKYNNDKFSDKYILTLDVLLLENCCVI